MPDRIATMRISAHLLFDTLNLPSDTRIEAARFYSDTNILELIISSRGLRPVRAGMQIPIIRPVFESKTVSYTRLLTWGYEDEDD